MTTKLNQQAKDTQPVVRRAVLDEARKLSQHVIGLAHAQGLCRHDDDRRIVIGQQLSEANLRLLYLLDAAGDPSSAFPAVPYAWAGE